ncbi:Endoprotease bli-4, partial [Schistosoma japonicum]
LIIATLKFNKTLVLFLVCTFLLLFTEKLNTGIRMLDGYITDRVEAETLHFRQDYIDIYSGSWGPEDSGKLYEGPGILAQSAFQQGIVTGNNNNNDIY